MKRLSPGELASLPPNVGRPTYARAALRAGIVHLGIGAFARAHLAAVNEQAIQAGGAADWGIVGISMRSPATRDLLEPQSGLYTLALRDAPDGVLREQLRVIGNLIELVVAAEDPRTVVAHIARSSTRIVSLTVTEKGYCRDPASGALLERHPDILHDLAHPESPRSALGALVRGLQRRRERGLGPLSMMSLDNLPANGDVLRRLTIALASQVDDGLAGWIERDCSFPNSMVDRIVPRTTDADKEAVSIGLGCIDAWPVIAEPALDWAVEDRFVAGRPAWDLGGARFVESAAPFEQIKLCIVNASHSALAYLAASAGVQTVDAAMSMPGMRAYLRQMVEQEIAAGLERVPGVDWREFVDRTLMRFENSALSHKTHQIAMDGSQKLPQRLLGSLRSALARGGSINLLALAIAAWLRYLDGIDEMSNSYPVVDPLAVALLRLRDDASSRSPNDSSFAAKERTRVEAMLSYEPVFGDLSHSAALADAVAVHSVSLRQQGIALTLKALTSS